MRIREEYKKSGYFWLPNSEKKIPGTLSISDGGKIELEVLGLFDESIDALTQNPTLKRIIGHIIEENRPVTLENCFYKNWKSFSAGFARSLWHVDIALIGFAYNEGVEVSFNTFRFSIEGIDEWIGITGIKADKQLLNPTKTIIYQLPDEISFNLKNELHLLINFSFRYSLGYSLLKAEITHKTYFQLTSSVKRNLDEFISDAHKITNLLCFAIDQTVCLDDISATSDDISIKVYYPSLPFSREEPKIYCHDMLFSFKEVQKNAEKVFNEWFNAYNSFKPALDLYFSSRNGRQTYLDGRFLALAQGLETYHRMTSDEKQMNDDEFNMLVTQIMSHCPEKRRKWLQGRLTYGNEISLHSRINKIIEPFNQYVESSRVRSKLIRSIVDTRNYLTHYDGSLKSKASCGRNLYPLCLKMEAFFQLHFLKILGFSPEEIKSIIERCFRLKEKLDL